MNRRAAARFLLLLGTAPLPGFVSPGDEAPRVAIGIPRAFAQSGWREEFNAVCAETDGAMALSEGELTERIGRCDRLEARIALEEEPARKVYLRRLQMCRDLYRYVLRSRQAPR